jgi:hypothetical protein
VPLLFRCAKTVSELDLLKSLELLFERKQIPRIIVNIRNSRKTMEPLEAAWLPWAQEVAGSNPVAPTKPPSFQEFGALRESSERKPACYPAKNAGDLRRMLLLAVGPANRLFPPHRASGGPTQC